MTFYVGQKVVCVDDDDHPEWNPGLDLKSDLPVRAWISRGTVYQIRKIIADEVWLEGINRKGRHNGHNWADGGFFSRRFRPLTERKTDISVFKKMLNPADNRERV